MKFTEEDKKLLLNTVAKNATEDELNMFIHLCETYELDPYLKEIWFMKTPKKVQKGGNWDYPRLPNGDIDYSKAEAKIMTSRDGYLKVAQGHKEYVGPPLSFAVCEGDEFEVDAENYTVRHKFGSKRGKIQGAWSRCDRKGKNPSIIYVPFSEYFTANSTTWKQYPTAMIVKVAETFTLKRQFGISGMVTREELAVQHEDVAESLDREPEIYSETKNSEPTSPESNTTPTKETTPKHTQSKPATTPNKATDPTGSTTEEQKPANPAPEQKAEPAPESAETATPEPAEPENEVVKIILGRLQNAEEKDGQIFRTVKFVDAGTFGGICVLDNQEIYETLKTIPGGGTYNATVWDVFPEDDRSEMPAAFQKGRLVLVGNITEVEKETQAA